MSEWENTSGRFREPKYFRYTRRLLSHNVWYSMHTSEKKIRMVIGLETNYEYHMISITCGTNEKNFFKIAPIIENLISSSPVASPLSNVPKSENGRNDSLNFTEVLLDHAAKTTAKLLIEHYDMPSVTVEILKDKQTEMDLTVVRSNGIRSKASAPIAIDEPSLKPIEDVTTGEDSNGNGHHIDVIEESAAEQEPSSSEPTLKIVTMTQDEFLRFQTSVSYKIPGLKADYDIRLRVYNPTANESNKPIGDRLEYRIAFGNFFKRNLLNFKSVNIGAGPIDGVWKIVLFFDSDLHKSHEATCAIPNTGAVAKKKMSTVFESKKIGALLVENGELKVSGVLGKTTEFKWDVQSIVIKGLDNENNKNMYLELKGTPQTFSGRELPHEAKTELTTNTIENE